MLGIGGSEIIILGLLFLIIFGPNKLPQMARDIGKFVGEARRSIDEFKDELTAEADPDERPARRRESRNGTKNRKPKEKQSEDPEPRDDQKAPKAEEEEEESSLRDL